MNKFSFESRKGFTLIELLVVIGILAVLAAIAIPSVAGLIDRANVSADATNATEMTNAVERFVSEYELYKQDIASGVLDTSDLDGAQGRVYNVTGITTRDQVTKFESTGFKGKGINIDTKYPANEETLKAVVQNYTKTSSSTFEPKQSDCQFYYSPEVGGVIVGETGATISELNEIYFAGSDDATADGDINWICLDNTIDNIATDTANTSGTLDSNIAPLVIKTMTIDGVSYQFEEGMTWKEWASSKYCNGKFSAANNGKLYSTNENKDGWLCYGIALNFETEESRGELSWQDTVGTGETIFDIPYIFYGDVPGFRDNPSYELHDYNGYYYFIGTTVYRIPVQ